MEQQLLACPVCTLFLREGMSMQNHLNTHPKDQVIEALVRLYTPGRPFNAYSPPAIVNPYQVVSEEHIFLGRQQVTTNIIHAPFMGYPVYPNQQILGSSEFTQSESVQLNISGQESGVITTLVNYSNQEDYNREQIEDENTEKIIPEQCPIKESNEMMLSDVPSTSHPASPMSHHSEATHITDEDGHCDNVIVADDRDYEDEEVGKTHLDEENDPELSSSGLNIAADEKMPPRGELSGQESLGTTVNSVWLPEATVISDPLWVDKQEDNEKKFPCLHCHEEFTCPKERRVHVVTLHCSAENSESKEFQKEVICLKCGLQLQSQKELKAHMQTEHKRVSRQCTVCNKEFVTQELYAEHLLKVHPLECRTCGKTFHTKNSLYIHAKIHMPVKPYACTLCSKTFVTNQKLKEHMNGHTGFAPLQCNLCDKKFKRYSNLKQHKNNAHLQIKKKSKDYFCECGETFNTKKKLEWHKEIHESKPKQCMYCSERYVHLASLTRHIRKAHDSHFIPQTESNIKKKNVSCPICNMVFMEKSLKLHMLQHSSPRQYGCIVCGKRFQTKWNLHFHRWTHASRMSKPFKCSMCKGAFVRLSELQAHLRTHYGTKPFTCNHCGRQFNRKHNWQRHEKEHLQAKKYSCNECGKSFHRSYYLVDHSRVHTGIKPYSCHICNKTSSTKSNHNKHVKTHHAREPINSES